MQRIAERDEDPVLAKPASQVSRVPRENPRRVAARTNGDAGSRKPTCPTTTSDPTTYGRNECRTRPDTPTGRVNRCVSELTLAPPMPAASDQGKPFPAIGARGPPRPRGTTSKCPGCWSDTGAAPHD